ncbi:hypothetical protein F6R98_14785 [Candidatus Methylospira mobilis]|uniref:Lysozyme inhibitor LprI-like N-terminal domain-containing protein n=1 Tax=Candidatus Methylospira mobilis TaxID=1808979 RepID=A0A5Q0BIM9_9GAMM|nr:lysozyme inhibitor LprI family protein [Candidatus Methylospira mobilis]QFY43735.1 hypothetical protein F6R98_14785 [Candidatus Methylospira mobilis]WNV04722.1 lysozyme inhibitor LprI family protein [Candidatus Methylospira mobilis]
MERKIVLLVILTGAGFIAEAENAAPSFPCDRAKNYAETTICATPGLAAADRELAEIYLSVSNQGGIDPKALRKTEDHWLADVRNRCTTPACIRQAYAARKQELLEQSARAVSPAAWEETRPFPVQPALWSEVMALVGTSCARPYTDHKVFLHGFDTPQGFPPFMVIRNGVTVAPAEKNGSRFAFLIKDGDNTCTIVDVVVLPSSKEATSFLLCKTESDTLTSSGFGMRRTGEKRPAAYWSVDDEPSSGKSRINRVPLDVLGLIGDNGVICSEAEYTGGVFD